MKHLMLPLFYLALLNIAVMLIGYAMVKRSMIWQSWFMLIVSVSIIHFVFLRDAPVTRMLAIITTTFIAMKVIAVAMDYQHKQPTLTFKQWLVFSVGWAGMRAQPFETLGQISITKCLAYDPVWYQQNNTWRITFVDCAYYCFIFPKQSNRVYISNCFTIGWFKPDFTFRYLSIGAGIWRLQGVNTYYLFKQPAKAKSLGEFWGKRWNLAFSEMTSITIFRPLRSRVGNAIALMMAFLFSGLLHELALSLPVNNGYGLPLLYFFIQGAMVLVEKVLISYIPMFLQHPIVGRLWTFFWIVAPTPLLFHASFIKQVLWPLAGVRVF